MTFVQIPLSSQMEWFSTLFVLFTFKVFQICCCFLIWVLCQWSLTSSLVGVFRLTHLLKSQWQQTAMTDVDVYVVRINNGIVYFSCRYWLFVYWNLCDPLTPTPTLKPPWRRLSLGEVSHACRDRPCSHYDRETMEGVHATIKLFLNQSVGGYLYGIEPINEAPS